MRKAIILMISIAVPLLLEGCATDSRYIAAPAPPPSELGISSKDDRLSVSLNYLVIPNGPGSWVKDARWDEYALTVRNVSDKPLAVERIRLVDPRGLYIESGVNPYQLETLSQSLAGQYKDMGITLAIGVGGTAAVTGAAMAAGTVGAVAGAMALAPIAIIAAPLYYLNSQQNKMKESEDIRREFARRRLTTFTLSGSSTIPGSCFFPIIPSPKALVIDYRIGTEMKVLELSLEKLTGLHVLQTVEKK